MAITEGDKFAQQVSGECTSGGPKRLATDDDGKIISSSDSKIGHKITGLVSGRKTVSAAGTPEPLASESTPCQYVIMTKLAGQSGDVVFGGDDVVATLATRKGTPLPDNMPIGIPIDDLAKVYIDVTVNGEGLSFSYLT
jgi:hypothetical protein